MNSSKSLPTQFSSIMLIAMCFLVSCDSSVQTKLEANKDIVRRFVTETDAKNWKSYEELLSPQLVFHLPGGPPLDREQLEETEKMFAAAFPDATRSIDQLFAEGDRVFLRETFRGTHLGEFAGVAATEKSIELTANIIYRVESGKIVEIWGEADFGVLMRQIEPNDNSNK